MERSVRLTTCPQSSQEVMGFTGVEQEVAEKVPGCGRDAGKMPKSSNVQAPRKVKPLNYIA